MEALTFFGLLTYYMNVTDMSENTALTMSKYMHIC